MESKNKETWSKEFEIGVSKIDRQFYNMFSVFDDFIEFKNSTQVDYGHRMGKILGKLEKFAHEIAVLDNSLIKTENATEVDQYVVNSQKLLTQVDNFILHFNSNNIMLIDEIIDFLKKWLMVQLMQAKKVFTD